MWVVYIILYHIMATKSSPISEYDVKLALINQHGFKPIIINPSKQLITLAFHKGGTFEVKIRERRSGESHNIMVKVKEKHGTISWKFPHGEEG